MKYTVDTYTQSNEKKIQYNMNNSVVRDCISCFEGIFWEEPKRNNYLSLLDKTNIINMTEKHWSICYSNDDDEAKKNKRNEIYAQNNVKVNLYR